LRAQHAVAPPAEVSQVLLRVARTHLALRMVTISGIPMKEREADTPG
jgi:hypothetical protein